MNKTIYSRTNAAKTLFLLTLFAALPAAEQSAPTVAQALPAGVRAVRYLKNDRMATLQPGEQFEQYVVWQSKKH